MPLSRVLQPLEVPEQVWQHISMDFIEGLPKSFGSNVIYVVVDRFTKSAHFIPLTSHYIAKIVADTFFDQIFKLHGLPLSIISDKDKVFFSAFWQELFKLLGTKLHISSAYHPQSDRQTESKQGCRSIPQEYVHATTKIVEEMASHC